MQLWTYHPSAFRLDAADLKIDPTKGKYWNQSDICYQEVHPIFCERIGSKQFLWCCRKRHCIERFSEGMDLVEWELNVPPDVVRFYRSEVWEELIRHKGDWDNLIVDASLAAAGGILPVVLLPLKPEWIICHGPAPIKYPKH